MRLTVVLLIVSLMQVSAATFAQRVTLNEQQASLKKVFKEIRRQSGFDFYYDGSTVSDGLQVTVAVKDATVEEAMKAITANLPLTYEIKNNTVIVKKKEEKSILDKVKDFFQAIDVTGKVVDENGQPLPGATVKVKDGSQATTTDARGEFTLRQVQPDATLVVSFIGFQQLEVKAVADMGNIVMKVAESQLDQVQVIAYGKTSQRLSTGNVTTIKAEDIEKSPVTNVLQAIQGRVPGIFIQQQSGYSGSGMQVRIQGQNSILKGNDPFYVVDGIPYTGQSLPTLNGIQGAVTGGGAANVTSPLNYLNPNDIESISILKDADATSIYGSRAANGAILITTKKGKSGDTKVDIGMRQGIGQVTRKMKLLNTDQYLQMRRQAIINDGIDLNSTKFNTLAYKTGAFADLLVWDTSKFTDWQKQLIGKSANYTDANLSISGGNNTVNYLLSGAFHRETTVQIGDFSDQFANFHFNLNSLSKNGKLKLEFTGSYLNDNNNLPQQDLTATALQLPPNAPDLYNIDGSLNWEYSSGIPTFSNPAASIYSNYNVKTNNIVSHLSLEYQLAKGLNLKSTIGYTDIKTKELIYSLDKATEPLTFKQNPIRGSSFGTNQINGWDIEPQLTYHITSGKQQLDALIGSSLQQTDSYRQALNASGFSSDQLLTNIAAASSVTVPYMGSIATTYKYDALFGRLSYNYDQKYLVNINVRRDGSSRFGVENRFHSFGSIAAAWVFSDEDWLKENLGFLNFGKVRASYGTTGNDQIGDYSYLSLYTNLNPAVPYQTGATGVYPNSLPNPYLQWELTRKMQIGVDLGFFKDRILFNLNYGVNRSSNQLLSYSLPSITGFTTIASNFPATVQNKSWELTLTTQNIKKNDLTWSTSFNVTIPKNKLLSFDNLDASPYATSLFVGKSVSTGRYLDYAGVNPQTGLYQFRLPDGTISTAPGSDVKNKTIFLNQDPKSYGGLQNTITFKGFQLDFLLQFAKQMARNYFKYGFYVPGGNDPKNEFANQPVDVLNSWTSKGDNSQVQKYSTLLNGVFDTYFSYNYISNSNSGFSDASYIRLKNISLSWNLPTKWIESVHFRNGSVYILGQNLLTFTNYSGLDPETQGLKLPPLRVVTLGLRASF
ncbi:MAG TPA: SusC/RagA family TonB-linked outer membrane protein [Mucilaginibacter sp.]|nr:SusC/RagA family TonB-linked outer membrane protein [Mucilaginibacter sp.]